MTYYVVSTLVALAVWWDAHRLGIRYGGPSGREASLGAPGWAMITLVMMPIALPLYLWRRRRYLPTGQEWRGAGATHGSHGDER